MESQHCLTSPRSPLFTNDPCMLHRPAPQIISRPVISVTAVGLHIQIKRSNSD